MIPPVQFTAFLSYRHAQVDKEVAHWLERGLRRFRIPRGVSPSHPGFSPVRPRELGPIFLDREDLPAGGGVLRSVDERLARSGALVLVCSPRTLDSPFVAHEVETFVRVHGVERVFPVVAEGKWSDSLPRLLLKYTADGAPDLDQIHAIELEPPPGEWRGPWRRRALVRLVAGIMNMDPEDLEQRTQQERERVLWRAGSIGALVLALALWTHARIVGIERDQVLRLSDLRELRALDAERDGFGGPLPENLLVFEKWLTRARNLLQRRALHEEFRSDLDVLASNGGSDRQNNEVRWKLELVQELLKGLERLGSLDVPQVTRSLERARTLEAETVTSPEARQAWDRAIQSIRESRLYLMEDGNPLELLPQIGLLPLGQNSKGYWEFWALLTGSHAPRRAAPGAGSSDWAVEKDLPMILVLVPGGSFWLGAQSSDPGKPHYDPLARMEELPAATITTVPALFVSKYELTQSQWQTLTGENPSYFAGSKRILGADGGAGEGDFDGVHPVESVAWRRARAVLRRVDLELPTEAEWEWAARALSELPWAEYGSVKEIATVVNCQHSLLLTELGRTEEIPEPWKVALQRDQVDGHRAHAPVGSFPANGFGLHDMLGNVWELCQNQKLRYGEATSESAVAFRVMRGGGFSATESSARIARRSSTGEENADYSVGVRPVRRIRDSLN